MDGPGISRDLEGVNLDAMDKGEIVTDLFLAL